MLEREKDRFLREEESLWQEKERKTGLETEREYEGDHWYQGIFNV